MRYLSKEIILKNNEKLILRSCEGKDAQAFLDFFILAASQSENMIRYPEEITIHVNQEKEILEKYLMSNCQWMISCFDNDKIVGHISFGSVNHRIKTKHRATFGITILKEYWNCGLGKILLEEMITTLKSENYEQIELEVVEYNTQAIHLYEKIGFRKCGRILHGFKLKDGRYADLIMMVLFINKGV
ncbi:MAG: GNAT family N-acetyltransferase [Traorella sp.]